MIINSNNRKKERKMVLFTSKKRVTKKPNEPDKPKTKSREKRGGRIIVYTCERNSGKRREGKGKGIDYDTRPSGGACLSASCLKSAAVTEEKKWSA